MLQVLGDLLYKNMEFFDIWGISLWFWPLIIENVAEKEQNIDRYRPMYFNKEKNKS